MYSGSFSAKESLAPPSRGDARLYAVGLATVFLRRFEPTSFAEI